LRHVGAEHARTHARTHAHTHTHTPAVTHPSFLLFRVTDIRCCTVSRPVWARLSIDSVFYYHTLSLNWLVSRIFKYPFFGAFAWSRKTPYLRHFRPSVRMYQRGSHWTDLHEIRYWGFYENLSRNCRFG